MPKRTAKRTLKVAEKPLPSSPSQKFEDSKEATHTSDKKPEKPDLKKLAQEAITKANAAVQAEAQERRQRALTKIMAICAEENCELVAKSEISQDGRIISVPHLVAKVSGAQ